MLHLYDTKNTFQRWERYLLGEWDSAMVVVYIPNSLGSRSMARSTVSTDISSLETQYASPPDFPSLESMTMKLSLSPYHLATLSATTLMLSSPSYIPSEGFGSSSINVFVESSTHRDFEQHNLSYEKWRSVLHLSTQWEFASIRRLALNNIQPPTPHDQLLLARTYSVDHWVIPALSALCERSAPLSLDEARRMDIEDVVLVATVREDIRNHTLKVDAAEIPRRVEAAQAGKLVHTDSVDVPSAVPLSVGVQQPSSPVAEEQDAKNYKPNEVGGEARVSPAAVQSGR
jgi:hypothetical protein